MIDTRIDTKAGPISIGEALAMERSGERDARTDELARLGGYRPPSRWWHVFWIALFAAPVVMLIVAWLR